MKWQELSAPAKEKYGMFQNAVLRNGQNLRNLWTSHDFIDYVLFINWYAHNVFNTLIFADYNTVVNIALFVKG